MVLDNDVEKAITNKSLKIDCFHITLNQNKKNDPLKFSGSGTIYHDSNGELRLKFLDKRNTSHNSKTLNFFHSGKVGLVPDEDYFKLRAKDAKGNVWTSSRIHMNGGLSLSAYGAAIDIKLEDITSKKSTKSKIDGYYSDILIRGKRQLPFNRFIDQPDGSTSLRALEFYFLEVTVNIEQKAECLLISLSSETKKIDNLLIGNFIEALSIACGEQMESDYLCILDPKYRTTKISTNRKSSLSNLPNLISLNYHNDEWLAGFVEAFIKNRKKRHNELIRYWRRLTEALAFSETAALVVSISIEGMIKNYYPEKKTYNKELSTQIRSARKSIKNQKFPEKINSRILQCLSDFSKKSITARLKDLGAGGIVSNSHIKAWIALRNSTAHADKSVISGETLIEFINSQMLCIDLFYILICNTLDYRGKRNILSEQLIPLPAPSHSGNVDES